ERPTNLLLKKLSKVTLYVLLIWSVGITLFVRTALGLQDTVERDQKYIYTAAVSSIGPGKSKVFLDFTYEFYFAGRSLGWQLYTPYIEVEYDTQGNWLFNNKYEPKEKFASLLSEMDY